MISGFLWMLLELNIAASVAIVAVLAVRRPAHRMLGARAVYLMWALVPAAMLATFIPSRAIEVIEPVVDRIVITVIVPSKSPDWAAIGLGLALIAWIGGVVVMARAMVQRQLHFNREESMGAAGPAVVGFCYPRVVTPKNFAERFSHDERRLILTHEQIHIERYDSRINGIVALVRCICWFNPLVHVGAAALSADQELSCDAAVVERRPKTRRIYAATLIKTQTALGPLPIGCHWPGHPLKDRIALLAMKPLSKRRTLIATVAAGLVAAGGGVAAWAAQPERTIVKTAPEMFIPIYPIVYARISDDAPMRPDTEPAL